MAFERAIAEYIPFTTYLATDHVTPTAPTNPVATISKDGAGFGACENSVTSIATGACEILLSATEKTADRIHLRITSDNCDPVNIPIRTEADWTATRAAAVTTIAADVVNLDGAAMRGTDGANTVVPDAAGTAASLIGALNDLSSADVTAAVPTAAAIVTALFAKAGITAGGTATFNTIIKALYAMARGKVAITGGAYAYKDDDDSTTLFTLTPSTTQRTTA